MKKMNILFWGCGGAGIGPLMLLAYQAGHNVFGIDKTKSDYTEHLKKKGCKNVYTRGKEEANFTKILSNAKLDMIIYSSAIEKEQPDHAIFKLANQKNIPIRKRDTLLNHIIKEFDLKLIAIAGTHGKTTTTSMAISLLQANNIAASYSVGAKLKGGDFAEFVPGSKYFVYECDEYDYNFLKFHPHLSLISGIGYDHQDIYPTVKVYNNAFKQFIYQSKKTYIWQKDLEYLAQNPKSVKVLKSVSKGIKLLGQVNREDAELVVSALSDEFGWDKLDAIDQINKFEGVSRRFEQISENVFSDYAHTPEKIIGTIGTANDVSKGRVVVIYEGLHNTRQHAIIDKLPLMFEGVHELYVVPSYLARENLSLKMLAPKDLVEVINKGDIEAVPKNLNQGLIKLIKLKVSQGFLVLLLSAGGAGSLDEFVRLNLDKVTD